jgi:hypothetical protein
VTTQINGPTGPLGLGWHRVTWTSRGRPQYVVTDSVTAAVLAQAALEKSGDNVRLESWDDYPYDAELGAYVPTVSRETLKGA